MLIDGDCLDMPFKPADENASWRLPDGTLYVAFRDHICGTLQWIPLVKLAEMEREKHERLHPAPWFRKVALARLGM